MPEEPRRLFSAIGQRIIALLGGIGIVGTGDRVGFEVRLGGCGFHKQRTVRIKQTGMWARRLVGGGSQKKRRFGLLRHHERMAAMLANAVFADEMLLDLDLVPALFAGESNRHAWILP